MILTESLNKNLKLYPWFACVFHAYFWLPIYFLFFNSILLLEEVFLLQSIYFLSVVTMEVPSGWFSDRFGRKKTLVVASIFLTASYVLFVFSTAFMTFAIAQLLLAAGIAFNSGTDTSFLYESCEAIDKHEEYAQREATATRYSFLGTAAGGIIGGLIAILDYRGTYALSAFAGIILIFISLSFTEPIQTKDESKQLSFHKQIVACLRLLQDNRLLWLFGFAVFLLIINHIPYEFYQPYIETLCKSLDSAESVPIWTSIHLTVTTLIASWIAGCSIKFRNAVGTKCSLLSAAGLQIALIAVMHLFMSIPIALLTTLRSCPRAMSTAPLNAAITPSLPSERRATFLSLMSLVGKLGFALTLALFASKATEESWSVMSNMLRIGMWIGFGLFVFFFVTSMFIKIERATHQKLM
ncbi:MAG: MFS transporter [Planctomycetota bacterium]|nr:MFS transporter [Planctomycetota bacterium]